MADKKPLVFNNLDRIIEELQSGDRLDQNGSIASMSGLFSGGVATMSGATSIDVTAGQGYIYDQSTPTPELVTIKWTDKLGQVLQTTTPNETWWYFDDNSDVLKQTTVQPTLSSRRTRIYICSTFYADIVGSISAPNSEADTTTQLSTTIRDLYAALGNIKLTGYTIQTTVLPSLSFIAGQGTAFKLSANYFNDKNTPNELMSDAYDTSINPLFYLLPSGQVVNQGPVLDNTNYLLNGVITPIPGTAARVGLHFVYRNFSGQVVVAYGHDWYATPDDAVLALPAVSLASLIPSGALEATILTGAIIVSKGATDLTSATFVETNKFGGFGGGVGIDSTSYLEASNNLSDLTDPATAVDNLGLSGVKFANIFDNDGVTPTGADRSWDLTAIIDGSPSGTLTIRAYDATTFGAATRIGQFDLSDSGVILSSQSNGPQNILNISSDVPPLIADSIFKTGLGYPEDYSAKFTDRTLIDKEYVDINLAGSIDALNQQMLADKGQPGLTFLAVGYTTSGKVQGSSLGDNNTVTVYANGSAYRFGIVLYRESMSKGEPICFTGLTPGSIITSTAGFYGESEQISPNGSVGPMPLLSLGLAFKKTSFKAERSSDGYFPGAAGANQGWVHIVNGPLRTEITLRFSTGGVVQGQQGIKLNAYEYYRLYTDGNVEYMIESTNFAMACYSAGMDLDPNPFYIDNRLIMPLSNDGLCWTQNGAMSALYDNTRVSFYTRGNVDGELNSTLGTGVSPGAPISTGAAAGVGTGVSLPNYAPDGAVRYLADGPIASFTLADGAGAAATSMLPSLSASQIVAQPLTIADSGLGDESCIAIVSAYAGTAKVYEWNTVTSSLDLAYTIPLTRNGVTITTQEDQKHPAANRLSNDPLDAVPLVGQLNPGVIISDVPISVVVQNNDISLTPTIRSQNGTTTTGIISQADETLTLGITPETIKMELVEAEDGLLYRRTIGAGGVESWVLA